MINDGVIVAQMRHNDNITILGDESGETFPNEIIRVLKYICKNFANYILIDNQFIQFIKTEIRKIRIQRGKQQLSTQIKEIAPYFEEGSELTVFSVLDGEDLHGLE